MNNQQSTGVWQHKSFLSNKQLILSHWKQSFDICSGIFVYISWSWPVPFARWRHRVREERRLVTALWYMHIMTSGEWIITLIADSDHVQTRADEFGSGESDGCGMDDYWGWLSSVEGEMGETKTRSQIIEFNKLEHIEWCKYVGPMAYTIEQDNVIKICGDWDFNFLVYI